MSANKIAMAARREKGYRGEGNINRGKEIKGTTDSCKQINAQQDHYPQARPRSVLLSSLVMYILERKTNTFKKIN